jgi:hypothetical protein
MPSKNVKDFPAVQSVDITTSNSLLSVVNGELRRLSAGNLSMLSLNAKTGYFVNTGNFNYVGFNNNPLSVLGSGNFYLQQNIQNFSTGTAASADLVLTSNAGTDVNNYIDLGINNVGYSDPAFTISSGNDGYLYNNGGNLVIGTQTVGKTIKLHAGGTLLANQVAEITTSGINTTGTYRVNNVPYNTFTIELTHANDNPALGHNYFGINDLGYNQSAGGVRRRIAVAETCQIRKASWTHFVAAPGTSSSLPSTGYIINTSSNPVQTATVTTAIDSSSSTIPANYVTTFSTPINVTSGDLVVASLGINASYSVNPTNVRDKVILYCYN